MFVEKILAVEGLKQSKNCWNCFQILISVLPSFLGKWCFLFVASWSDGSSGKCPSYRGTLCCFEAACESPKETERQTGEHEQASAVRYIGKAGMC